MGKKQRFSLRKHKLGTVSVLIGSLLFLATSSVSAEEVATTSLTANGSVTQLPAQEHQAKESPVLPVPTTKDSDMAGEVGVEVGKGTQPPIELAAQEGTETDKGGEATDPHQTSELPPVNRDVHDWVKTKGAWDRGFKGQGKVIAIIDTGIDANHQAMRLTDVSTAKVTSKAAMEERKKAAGIQYGVWLTDKVIFAHNYVENNDKVKEVKFDLFGEEELEGLDIKVDVQKVKSSKHYRPQAVEPPKETVIKIEDIQGSLEIDWPEIDDDTKYESRGMHVTGIAAGNGIEAAATGERFLGIAPEAQVMFMRVFANDVMGTGDSLFIKAIEDAVALGVDAINLSLGSANGSQLSGNRALMEAIEKAKQAGVSVVVAAGNERVFGSDHDDPFVTNPDYGLVGSPSTGRTPTSVAAINNKWVIERLMTVEGLQDRANLNNGKAIYAESVDFKDIKKQPWL